MLLADLAGCNKYMDATIGHETPHVIMALWGQLVKQVPGECYHLMPSIMVYQTASGLKPGKWLTRLIAAGY